MSIQAGDLIRKAYPFVKWTQDYQHLRLGHYTEEGYSGGCRSQVEDGPEIMDGYCIQDTFYSCDAEGEIEYEVLAIVDMPRKFQQRVIYSVRMIEPEGEERKSSKAHMVTMNKFMTWVNAGHSSYPHEYEVSGV